MFKKNTRHQQLPLTSHVDELPEKLRKRLENTWGGVFYREIYRRIDEAPFAVLNADCGSRPNVAVNMLVGLEFLKAGNLRATVEATVRSVKLPFPEAQLPVRGKFRVTCMLIGSAAVANIRRIQRYLQARLQEEMKQNEAQTIQDCAQNALPPSFLDILRGCFARLLSPALVFMPGLVR